MVKIKESFWQEKEWNIRNILKRVVGYGLAAVFILAAILMTYLSQLFTFSFGDILPFLICAGLGIIYITSDIIILRMKKKKNLITK